MTKEEIQLLLRDLCARLPDRVICHSNKINLDGELLFINIVYNIVALYNEKAIGKFDTCSIVDIKPYLRPMSSMTKEEFDEYMQFIKHSWEGIDKEEDDYYVKVKDRDIYTDWLLSHHFDYRGLIEKGLALEAKEGMYKTE